MGMTFDACQAWYDNLDEDSFRSFIDPAVMEIMDVYGVDEGLATILKPIINAKGIECDHNPEQTLKECMVEMFGEDEVNLGYSVCAEGV